MIFLRLLFCVLIFPLFASIETDEVILPGDLEPMATVGDCVNVINGHFFQIEHDLTGNTIDPIQLTRVYNSMSKQESFLGVGFGYQFPLFVSGTEEGSRHTYALVSERDGFMIPYQSQRERDPSLPYSPLKGVFKVDRRVFEKGYTNIRKGNLRNWKATHPAKTWQVRGDDGTLRIYRNPFSLSEHRRKQMGLPNCKVYLLEEELKPNGNRLLFSYRTVDNKPYLENVRTVGRTGQLLNQLDITYEPEKCRLKTSCGKEAVFSFVTQDCYISHGQDKCEKKFVKTFESTDNCRTVYYKSPIFHVPKIYEVQKLDGRKLSVDYEDDRVINVRMPFGPDNQMIYAYRSTQLDKKLLRAIILMKIPSFTTIA